MIQKSVYAKLLINAHGLESEKKIIMKSLPSDGLVSMLSITEKQFQDIDNLLGESSNKVIDSDRRYIEL
jgi:CRISPR-associated protein Cas2